MPPHPSATYQRLGATIAQRMRMSPIDQLLEASRCECSGACELQQTLGKNR